MSKINDESFFPEYLKTLSLESRIFLKNPKSHEKVFTISGGVETLSKKYLIDRKDFPYLTLEVVTSGEGTLLLKNKKYQVVPGFCFFYHSGIPHKIKNSNTKMTKYFLNFGGREAEKIMNDIIRSVGYVFFLQKPQLIIQTLNSIIDHNLENSKNSNIISSKLTHYLLLTIDEGAVPIKEKGNHHFSTFINFKKTIDEHYLTLKNLNDVVEMCQTDKVTLCRLYKKYNTHQTPYQHLIQLKMNYALKLLDDPNKRVKDVAFELGFEDQFNFSRTFKRVFGIAPKTYQFKEHTM